MHPVVGRAPDADPVGGGVEMDGGAVVGRGHGPGRTSPYRPTKQLCKLLLEARQPAKHPDKSKCYKCGELQDGRFVLS